MGSETINNSANSLYFKSERRGEVRDWGEMSLYLPELTRKERKLLKAYFRAQKAVAEEQPTRAKELFASLDKNIDFEDFEFENPGLFAAVDVAVRGSTQRDINPSFRKMGED